MSKVNLVLTDVVLDEIEWNKIKAKKERCPPKGLEAFLDSRNWPSDESRPDIVAMGFDLVAGVQE